MATPTMIAGTRTLSNILADTIPVDMHSKLWHLDKVRWPTMSMLMKLRRDPVGNTVFKHLEDEKIPDWIEIETADSDTTHLELTTTAISRLVNKDIVFNPRTKRRMIIDEAPDSSTLLVNINSITTANAVGDKLLILTSANEEGSSARTAISTKKVLKTFRTQWVRNTSELTWDEADVKQYAVERERIYQIEQIRLRHKEELNYMFFWGIGSADYGTAATNNVRGATGLDETITSNVWAVPNGHLTRPSMFDFFTNLLQYNKDASTLLMPCSFRTINIISGWGLDLLQTTLGDDGKLFGMEFPGIKLGGKKLLFVHEPVFDEQEDLQGTAYILDIGKIAYRPFVGNENRDTKLYPNIKTDNNPQVYTDEIATHLGFEFFLEPAFGKITGIEF